MQQPTVDDKDPIAHLCLGRAYVFAKQFENAIGAALKALQLNPYFAAAHYSLGTVYIVMGRLEDGIDAIRNFSNPTSTWPRPLDTWIAARRRKSCSRGSTTRRVPMSEIAFGCVKT